MSETAKQTTAALGVGKSGFTIQEVTTGNGLLSKAFSIQNTVSVWDVCPNLEVGTNWKPPVVPPNMNCYIICYYRATKCILNKRLRWLHESSEIAEKMKNLY